jgi:SHS2 domain-containing protein
VEKAFEIIDHTADIGIVAYGNTIPQLFGNAALGMFSLILETGTIGESKQYKIKLSSPDRESLLVGWLNELLFLFDTKHLVFKRFKFDLLSETDLNATCNGAEVNLHKQIIQREIKAATYHMLSIDKSNNGYKAQIVFDI